MGALHRQASAEHADPLGVETTLTLNLSQASYPPTLQNPSVRPANNDSRQRPDLSSPRLFDRVRGMADSGPVIPVASPGQPRNSNATATVSEALPVG